MSKSNKAPKGKNKVVKESEGNNKPEFYSSMSNNPKMTRLRRSDTRQNIPRLVEFIDHTAILASDGTLTDTYYFKNQIHKQAPLVVGIARMPDGRVVKLPHGAPAPYYIANIGQVSTLKVEVVFETAPIFAGFPVSYKLRVYNLDIQ